jgi:hypothetical protein
MTPPLPVARTIGTGPHPACRHWACRHWAWLTLLMLKSGTRRAGVAVRGK